MNIRSGQGQTSEDLQGPPGSGMVGEEDEEQQRGGVVVTSTSAQRITGLVQVWLHPRILTDPWRVR